MNTQNKTTQSKTTKNAPLNLQDVFLNNARKNNESVTIFLMNGVQVKGTVKGFDSYVVVVNNNNNENLIYKHAISTIIPSSTLITPKR